MRSSIVAAIALISSFGLLAPAAQAAGVCYSIHANVNGQAVDQEGCTP